MKKWEMKQGFSLIELMITVCIVAILATIAIPSYQSYIAQTKTVDLFTAIDMGHEMVIEYLGRSGAIDCRNMDGTVLNTIPLIINNGGGPSYNSTGNDSILIPITSPNIYIAGIVRTGLLPVCAVFAAGDPSVFPPMGGHLIINSGIPQNTAGLISIPTRNTDGSISWALYSNGYPTLPKNIATFPHH